MAASPGASLFKSWTARLGLRAVNRGIGVMPGPQRCNYISSRLGSCKAKSRIQILLPRRTRYNTGKSMFVAADANHQEMILSSLERHFLASIRNNPD